MDFLSQHITQPSTQHTQIHQTCHQFSSSAYGQNSCEKSRAMQHGTLGLGHITIPPYHHSKGVSKERRLCEFDSKYLNRIDFTTDHSTWSTLLSLWYQLFKHPWTDERSCKTSLHTVDDSQILGKARLTMYTLIVQAMFGDKVGQMFHA